MFIKIRNEISEHILDLDKVTGVELLVDRMIIHFNHPDEAYTVFSKQEEYQIINNYFEKMLEEYGPNKPASVYPDPLYKE